MLINDLAQLPHDVLIVLDDFHVIEEPRIEQALATLVAHQPPQLHLLIASREDPPLPLARLRAQGQLVELRAQELRFSPEETATFLNQGMGLALSPQQAAELDGRIEGWVAGLQLAGLSLQKSDNAGALIAGLSSSHHFILTYLTEEVLRQQPPAVQDFLLQTSILERLTGPLCDAVRERTDSTELLDALYAANVFVIPLDAEHTWFRYHHLFRDLLQGQLQRTQGRADPHPAPARRSLVCAPRRARRRHRPCPGSRRLYRRLCQCRGAARNACQAARAERLCADRGRLAAAAAPGVAGGGSPSQRRLCLVAALARPAGRNRTLSAQCGGWARGHGGTGRALPAGGAATHRQPWRQRSWACGRAWSRCGAKPSAPAPWRGRRSPWRPQTTPMSRAPRGSAWPRPATMRDTRSKRLPPTREALPLCRTAGNAIATMLSVANLSLLLFERGELQEAAALCRRVIAEAETVGALHSPAVASVRGALAHVLYEWNELEEARLEAQHGARAGTSERPCRRPWRMGASCLPASKRRAATPAAAAQLVEQARQLRGRSMPAWVAPYIVREQVALALARGDEQAAQTALDDSGVAVDAPTDHTREVVHLAYLHLLLYRLPPSPTRPGAGRPRPPSRRTESQRSSLLAGRVLASAEAGGRLGRMIEALCVRAIALQAQGKQGPAQADLRRALQLAAPSGYIRLFLGLGPAMAQLLAEHDAPPAQAAYTVRLRGILRAAMGSRSAPAAQPGAAPAARRWPSRWSSLCRNASSTCCA